MTNNEKNILWLDLFSSLGYAKKKKLLDCTENGADIKQSFLCNPKYKEILTAEEYNKMAQCLDETKFLNLIESFASEGIEFVTIYDNRYPKQLLEIDTPPLCLYCKGNLQLLSSSCVSIVGSRKPTDYGVVTTKEYAKELSIAGITIVSGMAVGVDSLAHRTVLENDGATIAVLAGGLHNIYPSTNIALYRQLTESNLVITESSPNVQPIAYLFLARNRIIAGLSKATIVTEAAEKSGSLTTCRDAYEFHRKVFAVPGKINAPYSKGCNKLIKEKTAQITLEPADVLSSLGVNAEKLKMGSIQLDIKQQIVIDYIKFEKKTFQEIADHTHLLPSELNSILLELELDGLVYKLANNSYIMA